MNMSNPVAVDEEEGFVPIEKVAKYFSVSAATVRVWVRDGTIPKKAFIKIGRTYRFRLEAIADAFIIANEAEEVQKPLDGTTQQPLNLDFSEEEQE
jgi:excisionase family DNA binding protein